MPRKTRPKTQYILICDDNNDIIGPINASNPQEALDALKMQYASKHEHVEADMYGYTIYLAEIKSTYTVNLSLVFTKVDGDG